MRAMTYRGPYRIRVIDKPIPGMSTLATPSFA
jgi:hypothetical protein